jgi:hypothetical protein
MHQAGYGSIVVGCDDTLEAHRLDGTSAHDDDAADVFYLATHGRFRPIDGYSSILHSTIWTPALAGLGMSRLVVAVFDTCSLIDGSSPWQARWQAANLAPTVRLLLGFDGPAPCDRGSGGRGAAFAQELLKGMTFADAWLVGVKSSLVPGTGRPVAIGIGDDPLDAGRVLTTARLGAVPGPRSGTNFHLQARY